MNRMRLGRVGVTLASTIVLASTGMVIPPVAATTADPVGQVTEFAGGTRDESDPFFITAGPSGNMWFTDDNWAVVGPITPSGTLTEYSMTRTPVGIAEGPDGNLWVTTQESPAISKITPDGQITTYTAGLSDTSGPFGIAAGPDGNTWFADPWGDQVGKISPTGAITVYPTTPTISDEGPRSITLGPDGNMWFEELIGRFGKVTPDGVVTEYPAALAGRPYSIAAGPDGNLWFTEYDGAVGKITTDGVVTEYKAGITAGFHPFTIAAGPDGNLWFTELGGRIGKVTTAGAITEYSAGISGTNLWGIAAGPDGNMWFTEGYQPPALNRGHIAKIGTAETTPPTATIPGAPTGVTAAAGDGQATVSWSPPSSDGGSPLTSYTITSQPGSPGVTVTPPTSSATVAGLVNGTSYTFTVTASNAVGAAASGASNPVTPQHGAPPPQVATETVPDSGGTATTDPTNSGPTASDPVTTSVTVPATSGGGAVSIAETAVTEQSPSGYQFVGQQIDINSTAATSATSPLTIVFTVDESAIRQAFKLGAADPLPLATSVDITRAEGSGTAVVTPACTSIGLGGTAISPDPCVAERTYVNGGTDLRVTVLTSSASHWNTAIRPTLVSVTDTGFSPKAATASLGGVVDWTFAGTRNHTVTDSIRLGASSKPLFDSGLRASGAYGYSFWAAGTYSYGSTASGDSKLTGTVGVPVLISPSSGTTSTTFTVAWASRTLSGYVFDLQVRFQKAGSKTWSTWSTSRSGVTATGTTTAATAGAGTYAFHARLRNAATGKESAWSPDNTVIVR
jgi:streptogramin lyase/plastocyanin